MSISDLTNENIQKIRGDSDDTLIGNIGDSLKVVQSQSALAEEGTLFSVSGLINASDSDEDNPLLFLQNPTSSAKRVFIWRLRIGSSVTNTSMLCKLFINPTVTANGSAITPINRNIGGVGNPSTVVNTYTTPTVSSIGTLLSIAVIGQNTISIDLNETFSIILHPNNSLLVTGKPSSNNRAAAVSMAWQEVDL